MTNFGQYMHVKYHNAAFSIKKHRKILLRWVAMEMEEFGKKKINA